MKLLLVLAICIIESQAGGYDGRWVKGGWGGNGVGWDHGYARKTYGQTIDVKSDFYNDPSNVFDQMHVPAMHVPKVFTLEKSGNAPVVYSNNANGYGDQYGYGYSPKTYGHTFDVKSDFYNDASNVFNQKHVPAMHVPKVFTLEKSGYAPVVYYNNANGGYYANDGHGYASTVYNGHKYAAYDHEGDFTPNVVSGNSGDHGYVSASTPYLHHGYAPVLKAYHSHGNE